MTYVPVYKVKTVSADTANQTQELYTVPEGSSVILKRIVVWIPPGAEHKVDVHIRVDNVQIYPRDGNFNGDDQRIELFPDTHFEGGAVLDALISSTDNESNEVAFLLEFDRDPAKPGEGR